MLIIKPPQLGYGFCHRCETDGVVVRFGYDNCLYCDKCVEEMIAAGEAKLFRSTAHNPSNPVWQVNYELFTIRDFEAMLAEDARLPLFYPATKNLLLFLINNPEASWQEAATYIQRSRVGTPDLLKKALGFYRNRLTQPTYQPKGLKQRIPYEPVSSYVM